MMGKKTIAMIGILALALLANYSNADAAGFCSNFFTPSSNVLSGTTPSSLLTISLLIMLVMLLIAGILYAIGYAIRVDKLIRFAKSEIGEVAITVLLVFVFIGSFSATSFNTPSSMFQISKGTFSNSIYMKDCEALYNTSYNFVSPILEFMVYEIMISAIGTVEIDLIPVYFGITLNPFGGLVVVNSVIKMMVNIAAVFFGVNMATLFLLFIVYKLFPLFFFAGIVLRTIPWTRAAGGAFIGLFVAFYIILPLILSIAFSQYAVSPQTRSSYTYSTGLGSVFNTQQSSTRSMTENAVINISNGLSGVLISFIKNVLEPSLFYVVSIVLSIIITYNFMEVLGDMLGSPSLSSRNTLKRLL